MIPLAEWRNDLLSLALSILVVGGYVLFVRRQLKRNPLYTIQAVNEVARTAWVEKIMQEGKDILAVQTLRNSTMAATFLASTAVVLIIGVLTLSGQGERLADTWHSLNIAGATHSRLWLFKVMLLLLDFFVAFFCFSLAVRFFNHVAYMINVPEGLSRRAISPAHVAVHLNRGAGYYSLGMRAYYFSIPLIFWLFGPHLMLIATIVLICVLHRIDRTPRLIQDDYR